MPDLDLYVIHNLDRQAPSEALAGQLTVQFNATADLLARKRIDTARAILGDPARRARYDAHLGDPAAPPITEVTLAAIAGHPMAAQPSGLSAAFSQPSVRLVAIAAAILGLVLIIAISAVSCSGGNDRSGPEAAVGADDSAASTVDMDSLLLNTQAQIKGAQYYTTRKPDNQLVLTKAIDLPAAAFNRHLNQAWLTLNRPSEVTFEQFQDRSVGVRFSSGSTGVLPEGWKEAPDTAFARINPDGQVVTTLTGSDAYQKIGPTFDLARKGLGAAYYAVKASDDRGRYKGKPVQGRRDPA